MSDIDIKVNELSLKDIQNGRAMLTRYFPPRGKHDAKLMLVISNPSFDDIHNRRLLSGENEDEIKEALKLAGLPIEECWATSVIKYKPKKSKPSAKEIEENFPILEREIELLKPKLIITFGAEAFKAVMHKNWKSSSFVGEIIDCPYGKMLTTHSIGLVTAIDPTLRNEFRDHILYAKKFVYDEIKWTPFEYLIVDDPEENKEILKGYMDEGKWSMGIDAEWLGKKYTDDEVMYTFQYSCEPHRAVILDISKDGKTENKELLDSMKMFIENPKADLLGWNIRSDFKRLVHRGFTIHDESLGFDGMKAVAFFDSRWGKGLETGITKFTTYEHYYAEFYQCLRQEGIDPAELCVLKERNPELFYRYCAGDAVSHYTACINMRDEMKKMPKETQDYYFNTYLPLTNYLLDMEVTGIPIDIELMEKMTKQYTERYAELIAELNSILLRVKVTEFNPQASQDKINLLYKILKLDPPYYTKNKKPKPRAWYLKQKDKVKQYCNPSANGKAIATLDWELKQAVEKDPLNDELRIKYDIVHTLQKVLRVGVFANKFLNKRGTDFEIDWDAVNEEDDGEEPLKQSYWQALHNDGRIHPDFYECLNNFRASSRPNVQNPASKVMAHIPEAFKGSSIEVPSHLRQIFYTGDKDWYWAEIDIAAADIAIMALLSGDMEFIKDVRAGGFHETKMKEYFRDATLNKSNSPNLYTIAKTINFNISYISELKAAAIPIQAEIMATSGMMVDLKEIDYALSTWSRYTKYLDFREACKAQVTAEGMIENLRGFKYLFDFTDKWGVLPGWMNESLAFPIASELALFMWDVSVQLRTHFKKQNEWMKWLYPVTTVHDANYWMIHKDLMKDNYFPEITKEYFTNKVKIVTGDNLGMEIVISDCWKGKEKHFSKETKWDWNTNSWTW